MQNDFLFNLYYIYLHRLSATIKGAMTDATNQGTLNFSFLLKKKACYESAYHGYLIEGGFIKHIHFCLSDMIISNFNILKTFHFQ